MPHVAFKLRGAIRSLNDTQGYCKLLGGERNSKEGLIADKKQEADAELT